MTITNNSDKNIGKFIRDSRRSAGMTQTQLATYLGISLGSVYKYEKGKQTPAATIYNKINELNNKGSGTLQTQEISKMNHTHYEQLVTYQETEINQLKLKILNLERKITKINKKDAWLDIQYDVKTRQFYNKSFLDMTEYEMIKYSDFFKKLGYNDSEIKKEYEFHKKHILDLHREEDDYGIIHKKWISSGKKISTWATLDKNGKEIPLTLWLDLSKTLGKSVVTYDSAISYIKKDGSLLNAHIYCCWDLIRMTGEAKIKFLST